MILLSRRRFSQPGYIYKRSCDTTGVTPVQLIGEGSFHQLHGGATTNTPWKRVRLTLGFGTSEASFDIMSSGLNMMCLDV